MDQDFDKFVELAFSGDDVSQTGNQNFFDDDDVIDNTLEVNSPFDYDKIEKELLKKAKEIDEEEKNNNSNRKQEKEEQKNDDEDDDDNKNNDENEDEDDDEKIDKVEIDEDQSNLFFQYLTSENFIDLPKEFKSSGNLKQDLETLLDEKFNSLKEEAKNKFLEVLPEDYRLAAKFAIANPGKSLSDYADFYNANISATQGEFDLENISLEKEEDQIKLYETYLKLTTKYSPDKIKKQIKILSDNGELYAEAKDALTELITIEAQAKLDFEKAQEESIKDKEKQEKEFRNKLVDLLNKDEELGVERKKKIQALINNKITLENGVQTNGFWHTILKLSNNSQHLIQLADLLIDYSPEKGINIDRLIALGKKQQLVEVQKKIDNAAGASKKDSGSSRRPKTTQFDWEKWALGEL